MLCLVGVDYFSTLAYLPSIAVEAAGPLGAGRRRRRRAGHVSPGAAGLLVRRGPLARRPRRDRHAGRSDPGWRGKLVVLTLLGFAAADFVITRSLSLADAAVHLIHNPHGQRLLERLPASLLSDDHALWPPLEYLLQRLAEPQVAITLGLSIISFGLWQLLKRGVKRRILLVTAGAVSCYLALSALVIGSALVYIAGIPRFGRPGWTSSSSPSESDGRRRSHRRRTPGCGPGWAWSCGRFRRWRWGSAASR